MNCSPEPAAADVGDRVLNRIFACGLTIAGLSGRPDISVEVAQRLHDVVEELDMAVTEFRRAFTALAADRQPHPDEPVAAVRAASNGERRRLRRIADDAVFAYAARGHDFYRVGNHELWAHESEGLLLSARSGRPLARRTGNVFYDLETNAPLYYEDRGSGPSPVRTCGGSPAAAPGSWPIPPIVKEGVT